MKLPPDAIIDPRKVKDYLLQPQEANDKSKFLALAGYTQENPEQLLADLRSQLLTQDAEVRGTFAYGIEFVVRGVLRGPNGRNLRVVSIWAKMEASSQTRFITLYPDPS